MTLNPVFNPDQPQLVGVAALGKHGMYAWLIPTRYGLGTDAAKAKGEALLPSERADPLV